MSADGPPRAVVVWDGPTRLFHWLTVVLVAAAYVTLRLNWMGWHILAGEALLALLLFRLSWGLFGSETSRFSRFLTSPGGAARHLIEALRHPPHPQVGHNPAGGWMVMALLALLLGQTLSGLYVSNDVADEGPLTELVSARIANLVSALHDVILWDALLAAVALHLLAIIVYTVKRHDLLRPMITGRKMLPASVPPPREAPWARAALLFGGSAAVTALLVHFL